MAIKFLTIATVLTATILLPIHEHYDEKPSDHSPNTTMHYEIPKQLIFGDKPKDPKDPKPGGDAYLWVYVIFVYLFSGIAFYLLYTYTIKVTRVRQAYLGHQSTITDRTIRLSGIPPELRSEEAIKSHIQAMGIGEVESVNLCRDWRELDHLILEREKVLRQLEEAQTIFLRRERVQRNLETLPIAQPDPPSPRLQTHCDEAPLLRGHLSREFETRRPTLKLRFGFMGMRSRKVDAIDHFTMKLGALDAQIKAARKREYPATPIAFVTLDSVAAAVCFSQAFFTRDRC